VIYKPGDGTRVRVTSEGDALRFETYRYTPLKETLSVEVLSGEEAKDRLAVLKVADGIRFAREYGGRPIVNLPQTLDVTARQIRPGDIFVLHTHLRVAATPAFPTANHHVHIRFVGGGDAVIGADYPLTVTRPAEEPRCSA
jgi:hypothetical protein